MSGREVTRWYIILRVLCREASDSLWGFILSAVLGVAAAGLLYAGAWGIGWVFLTVSAVAALLCLAGVFMAWRSIHSAENAYVEAADEEAAKTGKPPHYVNHDYVAGDDE